MEIFSPVKMSPEFDLFESPMQYPSFTLGNVTLDTELGRGTSAVVFGGTVFDGSVAVAVKVFTETPLDSEAAAEVMNYMLLSPPDNCADDIACFRRGMTFSVAGKTYYAIAVERMDGDITTLCHEQATRLSPVGKLHLFSFLSMAFAAMVARLHASDIAIHDLKPGNVGFRKTVDGSLSVKLIDLGQICHFNSEKHTSLAAKLQAPAALDCFKVGGSPFFTGGAWYTKAFITKSDILKNDWHTLAMSIKDMFVMLQIRNDSPLFSREADETFYNEMGDAVREELLPMPTNIPPAIRGMWSRFSEAVQALVMGEGFDHKIIVNLYRALADFDAPLYV